MDVDLAADVVDLDRNERLDLCFLVDPRPDLPLMLVGGRALVEVRVAAEEGRPGLELVRAHGTTVQLQWPGRVDASGMR